MRSWKISLNIIITVLLYEMTYLPTATESKNIIFQNCYPVIVKQLQQRRRCLESN